MRLLWSKKIFILRLALHGMHPKMIRLSTIWGGTHRENDRNGFGRYEEALAAAELAAYEMEIPNGTGWALPEVIEAAVRCRRQDVAREAMRQLPEHTLDTDWAAGIEARCRALVSEGSDAEGWYLEAVERLASTPFRTELGRAPLTGRGTHKQRWHSTVPS